MLRSWTATLGVNLLLLSFALLGITGATAEGRAVDGGAGARSGAGEAAARASSASPNDEQCDALGPRVDCGGMTADACATLGCCWSPAEYTDFPRVDVPWCFRSNGYWSSYDVESVEVAERPDGTDGPLFQATLHLSGDGRGTQPELGEDVPRLRLTVEDGGEGAARITLRDADRERWEVPPELFRSEFFEAAGARRQGAGGGRPGDTAGSEARRGARTSRSARRTYRVSTADGLLEISVDSAPLALRVARKGEDPFFDTTGRRLIYKDRYLELTQSVPASTALYGLGSRGSSSLRLARNGAPRPIWARDIGPTLPEQNSYAASPWVVGVEASGRAHGVLLWSSAAMDVVPSEERLSWRATGGVLDLFVFSGPSPLGVLEQYTHVVGRPALPPRWALGWQQSKYGWRTLEEVEGVVAGYDASGLPLEVIWADIDHMDRWRDFTWDEERFPRAEVAAFVGKLHEGGRRFVPILDPGIAVDDAYEPYRSGMEAGIFLAGPGGWEGGEARGGDGSHGRDTDEGRPGDAPGDREGAASPPPVPAPYLGWVWPGAVHFPEFETDAARAWWAERLALHHRAVPYDGLWIDMDEASNFCSGDVCEFPSGSGADGKVASQTDCNLECRAWDGGLPVRGGSEGGGEGSGDDGATQVPLSPELTPYQISNALARQPLGTKAISPLARHRDGSLEIDRHNLYGVAEARATAEGLEAARNVTLPFVLTRASFPGSGAYAVAHWTGDNAGTWEQLGLAIPGFLQLNLAGASLTGVDICGFHVDAEPELCARWLGAGALYPFSRSHSGRETIRQEPYLWPQTLEAARNGLAIRYKLLDYILSAARQAHETGAPTARPLWFLDAGAGAGGAPWLSTALDVDRQWLLGSDVLVSPPLTQGASRVDAFFPPGTWRPLSPEDDVGTVEAGPEGTWKSLNAPLGTVPVHVRGGCVVPIRDWEATGRDGLDTPRTTAELSLSPLSLLVALDDRAVGLALSQGGGLVASGWAYLDGNETSQARGAR